MKEKNLKSSAQYRDLGIELLKSGNEVEDVIDVENRTVTFPFSSEQPVQRDYFDPETGEVIRANEVLDHSGEVDFERLKQAGSLLVGHDKSDLVGVVEDVWLDRNRGVVKVRFGKSNRASEIFNDVVDGIRRTVSFGYRVLEAVRMDTEENELPTMLIKRWSPFEVSLENIPADITVGVGRNSDEEYENDFIVRSEEIEEEELEVPKVTITKENKMSENTFETGIKAERKRLNGMDKIADSVRHLIPQIDELKEEFKNSERTLDEFNAAIVQKMDSIKVEKLEARQGESELDLTPTEVKQFSILRLVDALASNNFRNAGYELEVSQAQAELQGVEARGAYVPLSILGSRADAALTTSSDAIGGDLIPTDFWGAQYIDVLRANSVVANMGARIIPGLVGDVDIPKAENGAAFGWITEGAEATGTQYSATTVPLSPQDIAGSMGFTRKMMKQTGNPAIENIIRNDLNAGIGVFLDKQVLVGTQAGASGLTTSAGSITADTTVSNADVILLETNVATNNAELGSLGYVCAPSVRGILKGTVKASGQGGFLMADDGSVNGYKCGVTSHAGTNLFYGNWNDILVPMWGGVDIIVDPYTNVKTGGVVLRAFLSTDIAYRNAESFAVQTGIVSGA